MPQILNVDSRTASFLTPASLIVICSSFSVYNCLEIDENRRRERSLKVFKQHFDHHCVLVFVLPQLLILYKHYGNFLTLSEFRKKILYKEKSFCSSRTLCSATQCFEFKAFFHGIDSVLLGSTRRSFRDPSCFCSFLYK